MLNIALGCVLFIFAGGNKAAVCVGAILTIGGILLELRNIERENRKKRGRR